METIHIIVITKDSNLQFIISCFIQKLFFNILLKNPSHKLHKRFLVKFLQQK